MTQGEGEIEREDDDKFILALLFRKKVLLGTDTVFHYF